MSLSQTSAVIDFGTNTDRVTIKCSLVNVPQSTDTAHFKVRVVIVDQRDGSVHDTGDQNPTVVR